MTPTPPAPGPPDDRDDRDDDRGDPAAPLEAYIAAIEHVCGEYCDDAMLVDDADARGVRLHLGDLRQAAAALREQATTISRLRAELAAERARLDWIESGGDVWGSPGNWSAWEIGDAGSPMHEASSLREAIDKAREGGGS